MTTSITHNQSQIILKNSHGESRISLEQAREELIQCERIIFTGFLNSSLETCRAAILLAEQFNAYCDPWLSPADRIFLSSWTREAWATCTRGEVLQRADFILLWHADFNDSVSKPFLSTLSMNSNKNLWSINSYCDSRVPDNQKFSVNEQAELLLLRILKSELQPSPDFVPDEIAVMVTTLLEQLRSAHYPVVIWGETFSNRETELTSELQLARLRWIRHASHRYRLHHLRQSSKPGMLNFQAAANWLTGYTSGISFLSSPVSADPLLFAADRLINESAVDIICWTGHLPVDLANRFRQSKLKFIHLAESDYIQEQGTYLREDGVPVYREQGQQPLAPLLNQLISLIAQ